MFMPAPRLSKASVLEARAIWQNRAASYLDAEDALRRQCPPPPSRCVGREFGCDYISRPLKSRPPHPAAGLALYSKHGHAHAMSDDDWDTDPDFKNDLTEAEKRAYGNRETMEKYQSATGGHGAALGAESGALNAPAPPPPKMGEVLSGEIGAGPTPAPEARYSAPTRVEYAQPQMPPRAPMEAAASAKPAAASAVPARRPSKQSVFDRPKDQSDAEVQELRDVFDAFDADRSGRISVEELSSAMQQMQLPVERGKLVAPRAGAAIVLAP